MLPLLTTANPLCCPYLQLVTPCAALTYSCKPLCCPYLQLVIPVMPLLTAANLLSCSYLQLVTHVMSRLLCVHGKVEAMMSCQRGVTGHTQPDEHCGLLAHHTPLRHDPTPPSLLTNGRDICENGTLSLQTEVAAVRASLHEVTSTLKARLRREERKYQIAVEWKCVALVLDRTFFYLYLAAIIVSLVVLFPRPA